MIGTTEIFWTSDEDYTGYVTCISLEPVLLIVKWTNNNGKSKEEHWEKDKDNLWREVTTTWGCNDPFKVAMDEALEYFRILAFEQIVLLDSSTESKSEHK